MERPLHARGRKVPVPYVPPLPCNHEFTEFMPLEDFLSGLKFKKLDHNCAVQYCIKCGMTTGLMW